VKQECLWKSVLPGEPSLRQTLSNHVRPYHDERNHLRQDSVIQVPAAADGIGSSSTKIGTRERLRGLMKFHHRRAA